MPACFVHHRFASRCRDDDYAQALTDGAFGKVLHVQLARKVEGNQFFEVRSADGQPVASAWYAQLAGIASKTPKLYADWAPAASRNLKCWSQRLTVLLGKLQRPEVLWTCVILHNLSEQ